MLPKYPPSREAGEVLIELARIVRQGAGA